MEKEEKEKNIATQLNFEKEVDELGTGIINIKINKSRHKNKDINNNENKKENEDKNNDINNNEKRKENEDKNSSNKTESIINNNNINNESFNLDAFNNFLEHNKNFQIQVPSNNKTNQLKSHLKPHLKLNLGIKKPTSDFQKIEKGEDIKDNININDINSINNMNNNSLNKIKNNNTESSFILKQKFDNINESQISYEASNASFQNNISNKSNNISNNAEQHKVKKKFKLSLYQLQKLALLGAGSSGEVYLVQDTVTKKKLALKSVKYSEEEKTKAQLETEVKLGTLLKHENIIRIYATYFLKGRINFVMEYMDKGTISDILKKVKKMPEKIVGLITYQVVHGLAYCQKEKKIIHRDLKPSNILVNSKGEIKIADFGVSAILEGSWAQKKTMIGTYLYMAPERIDADSYTLNSDIWSLGIIVMECILGYYPYIIYNNNKLPNSVWMVHELIENNPIPKLDDNYSNDLIDFIQQCLIKDINQRPKAVELINHNFIKKYNNYNKNELALWIKSNS